MGPARRAGFMLFGTFPGAVCSNSVKGRARLKAAPGLNLRGRRSAFR